MKTFPLSPIISLGLACLVIPLAAQNPSNPEFPTVGRHAVEKVRAWLPDPGPLYLMQNCTTLDAPGINILKTDPAIDEDLLRQPSIYRELSGTRTHKGLQDAGKILGDSLALLSATYRESAKPVGREGCGGVALAVRQQIRIDPAAVLEIVETEVSANPGCACEIVKSAIQNTDADPSLVAGVVETSIRAAPEFMRLISQCAMASAPESLPAIQQVMARLDSNGGESGSSSKDAKSAKIPVAASIRATSAPVSPNPLERLILYPMAPLPISNPPPVTDVNP